MSRIATPLSVLAVAGASIALAACGSSSGNGSASSANAAARQGQQPAGTQSAAFKKFQDCLKDNGVTLPDRGQRPGGGQGYGTPPAGGAPGAGGFADNPKLQAAMKACAKLRPQGLGNGRGGPGRANPQQGIKAFTPYLTCLKSAGLDVNVSDGFNALRNLKQDDPKVQAAFKSCQSKLPQRPSSTQPPTTTSGSTT